jgi:F-type H+-transporting ATPase subunit epsilon
MPKLYQFEIYTPYRLFYTDTVEALVVSLIDGEIGIYGNHSFLTAPVDTGVLKIKGKDGKWSYAFTSEGILEVTGHKTVLLVDSAEWPEEIDKERALAAKKGAEDDLRNSMFNFETSNARNRLKRAETRIKVWGLRTGDAPPP